MALIVKNANLPYGEYETILPDSQIREVSTVKVELDRDRVVDVDSTASDDDCYIGLLKRLNSATFE